jgi:cellobiose phosphorylase
VPKDFGDFELTRKFREGTYNIKVTNPDGVEKGIKSITVDGQSVEGCVIPYVKGKEKYDVLVTMG